MIEVSALCMKSLNVSCLCKLMVRIATGFHLIASDTMANSLKSILIHVKSFREG